MKVKDFIRETNWTQKALCRDAEGVEWRWPYAGAITQWDLVGMVLYCYRDRDLRKEIFSKIEQCVGITPYKWNDQPGRTWEQVRDLVTTLDI